MSISGLKKTTFGRKFVHQYENTVSHTLRNGETFKVSSPKNMLLIRDTVKPVKYADSIQYMNIQQLNSCDACILSSGLITKHGEFTATMYLVSYDTVVCTAIFHPENRKQDNKPYVTIEVSEHWNYSRTTVQHVYKFLRRFGITTLGLSELEKQDKRTHNGKFGYTPYEFRNNVNKLYEIVFCSDIAINDYIVGEASRVVYRAM